MAKVHEDWTLNPLDPVFVLLISETDGPDSLRLTTRYVLTECQDETDAENIIMAAFDSPYYRGMTYSIVRYDQPPF